MFECSFIEKGSIPDFLYLKSIFFLPLLQALSNLRFYTFLPMITFSMGLPIVGSLGSCKYIMINIYNSLHFKQFSVSLRFRYIFLEKKPFSVRRTS